MKRNILKHVFAAACVFSVALTANLPVQGRPKKPTTRSVKRNQTHKSGAQYTSAQAKKIIASRARAVVLALKANDTKKLSRYVHPQWGVRVMPIYVPSNENRIFSRAQVASLAHSRKKYDWGYDGYSESDDPGKVYGTWSQFLREYIYSRDYIASPQVTYNIAEQESTTPNKLRENYPSAILVNYHIPDDGQGPNWGSLWLVFQQAKTGNDWYLVGIAHNEWTM